MASWSLSFIFGVIIMRYHYEKPSIFLSMLRILKRFSTKEQVNVMMAYILQLQ